MCYRALVKPGSFIDINQFLYTTKLIHTQHPNTIDFIREHSNLNKVFLRGGTFYKYHEDSVCKKVFHEKPVNALDSAQAVVPTEFVVQKEALKHGQICVSVNNYSPQSDMIITTPSGDFISAWQFKNRDTCESIYSFYKDVYRFGSDYEVVNTPFGEKSCKVLYNISQLSEEKRSEIHSFFTQNPLPKNVDILDISKPIDNIIIGTVEQHSNILNPVLKLVEEGKVLGGFMRKISKKGTFEYNLEVSEYTGRDPVGKVVNRVPVNKINMCSESSFSTPLDICIFLSKSIFLLCTFLFSVVFFYLLFRYVFRKMGFYSILFIPFFYYLPLFSVYCTLFVLIRKFLQIYKSLLPP